MKKINFLVLTKSAKHNNYCVAGFNIETNQMVRLCSKNPQTAGALSYNNLICTDNSVIETGDVIEVAIIEQGSSKIQIENLIINENIKFKKVDKFSINKIASFVQNEDYVFLDTSYKLPSNLAQKCNKSLLFLKVSNLVLTKDYNKTKGAFFYNGNSYSFFSVTDQTYFNTANVEFTNALICFSLPDDEWAKNANSYFKYISKIIPI